MQGCLLNKSTVLKTKRVRLRQSGQRKPENRFHYGLLLSLSRLLLMCLAAGQCHFLDTTQVHLACAQQWDLADFEETI